MKVKNLNRQLFQRSMQLLLLFLMIIGFLQTSLIYLYTENQRKMEVETYLETLQQTPDLLGEEEPLTKEASELAEDFASDANIVFLCEFRRKANHSHQSTLFKK